MRRCNRRLLVCLCISWLTGVPAAWHAHSQLSVPPSPTTRTSVKPFLPCRRAFLTSSAVLTPIFLLDKVTNAAPDALQPLIPEFDRPLRPGGAARYAPVAQTSDKFQEQTLEDFVQTKLGRERLLASELSPLQQPFLGNQELYCAPFLFGAWHVQATLQRKLYPYGTDFVPFTSLIDGSPRNRDEQVGNTVNYETHYFSTLANTVKNQITVNAGLGVPETKIIQDRAYNAIAISKAYDQLTPVQEVAWNYAQDPTRQQLSFAAGSLAADMRPLGPRRTEVYVQARVREYNDNDAALIFCSAERTRSLTLALRDAVVSETEIVTEFHQITPDHVTAISRIVTYLSPNPNSREGILWEQTKGRAVAFFDYELDMTRQNEEFIDNGRKVRRACVTTPKDVRQCE